MKKWIRNLGIAFALLIILLVSTKWILDEPLPKGVAGPEAELVAQKMLESINKEAWDSTQWVTWSYKGARKFVWDRKRGFLKVEWDENTSILDLNDLSRSVSYQSNAQVEDAEQVQKAWSIFCNDSFWLNAPSKVFDEGTTRYLVDMEDGNKGLLVSYSSGGVTPGDSYLWILDENHRPVAWKMWVSILPFGGVKATWEDWQTTNTDAVIATMHKVSFIDLPILDLKTGNNFSELNIPEDPFSVLSK